jgi:hypothetical protein
MPGRFPLVCLQFDRTQWKIQARHVIGRNETRERLLALLDRTSWGLHIDTGERRKKTVREALVGFDPRFARRPRRNRRSKKCRPPFRRRRPLPNRRGRPKRFERRRRPRRSARGSSPTSFSGRRSTSTERIPGIVAITQPEILVASLDQVAKEYFDRAVRLCLGVRDPREGERVILTSGEAFSKEGRIRDCVFITPRSRIPKIAVLSQGRPGIPVRRWRWSINPSAPGPPGPPPSRHDGRRLGIVLFPKNKKSPRTVGAGGLFESFF